MAPRVYLESIGCKLNQCERDALARQFAEAGYTVVSQPGDADICVLNTCAVTHVAARKSRQRLRSLHRLNTAARLVATGCSTGLVEDGLQADLVVTNEHKPELVSRVGVRWSLCQRQEPGCRLRALTPMAEEWPDLAPASPVAGSKLRGAVRFRTRPLVKIQDGCDNGCTYCIVRVLRGPQKSRPRGEILEEIAAWVGQGYHEIVLTGVHVGSYGQDTGDDLAGLVRAILAETAPDRLRLSSIEPWDLSPKFLDLWHDPRLCRHLHLPLQSGCDDTLRRMNRRYTAAEFAALVAQARAAIPGLAVTTDVIAGFPGETDQEFATSAAFIANMAFARVHVFPYSPRPGTPAADMPAQVDSHLARERARQLREIGARTGEAFRRQMLGRTLPVLWETRSADGRWSGLTDNYLRVYAESEADLKNTLWPARLCALDRRGVRGEIVRACETQT
jgi:threonylcarbamoyladenosine tRNA methylthiotransferase MtaB